jgi:hypothetical protein
MTWFKCYSGEFLKFLLKRVNIWSLCWKQYKVFSFLCKQLKKKKNDK